MKKIIVFWKWNSFFICLLIFFFFFANSCNSIRKHVRNEYYKYIINLEAQILRENNNVLTVKVLRNTGDWGEKKLWMKITFIDDQWIFLKDVGSSLNYIILQ
jgi:hypothetical protein